MHDAARAAVDRPLELGDRPVDVAQRDVRRREDAVVVVAAPVLVEPAVERRERERDGADVVLEQFLVEHAERREQPHGFEAELVEPGDAGVAIAVLGRDRLALDQEFPGLLAVGIAAEVVVHRAGLRDRVERRVHDRVAHLATDHVVPPAVDLGPLHAARPELRVEVAGEGVERLVVVVVGVEGLVGEFAHEKRG